MKTLKHTRKYAKKLTTPTKQVEVVWDNFTPKQKLKLIIADLKEILNTF